MNSIPPELLARLMQVNPQAAQAFINEGGQQYTPLWDIQGQGYDGPTSFNRTGYAVGAPYQEGGGSGYGKFDLAGNDTGQTGQWQKDNWNYDTQAMMLAAAGLGGFALMAPGMAGAAAGGGSGAFLGEGVASGIPAWDAAGSGLAGGGAAGGGMLGDATAMGYGGLDAGSAATMGGGASVGGGSALGGAAAAGGAASGGAATAGGLLSGAGSLLGPAAAILGAAAGAKGQQSKQTTTRDLPPELKPFVYGQGGLLQGAQGLFQQQTAPGAMPGYQQMQTTGMGLLQQPMAGNGFQQFMQRPRFGG